MKNIEVILIGVILIGFFVGININSSGITFGSGENIFTGGVTNASTTVATSSTSVLARNVSRQYAIICNNDGTNFVNLSFHASAAVATEGIQLAAGECYEINSTNLYKGAIYGIADTAAVVVTTIEK